MFAGLIQRSIFRAPAAAVAGPSAIPTDNFNDNSRDVAIWAIGQIKNSTAANVGTVNETNSRVEVTPPTSTAGLNYSGYVTVNGYDMTGQSIYARYLEVATISTSTEPYMAFGADANNHYMAVLSNGQLYLVQTKAGTETAVGPFGFSFTVHAWWRLRHGGSGDETVYLDTAQNTASNPPISGDWTNRLSMARDGAVTITSSKLAFGVGTWTSEPTPGTGSFDGFNTAT